MNPDPSADEPFSGVLPVIDRNRCEGKAACVPACPYQVLEIRRLNSAEKSALSLRGRLKAMVHGNRQAFLAKPSDCHACGRCIEVCPEGAISFASR